MEREGGSDTRNPADADVGITRVASAKALVPHPVAAIQGGSCAEGPQRLKLTLVNSKRIPL